MASTPSTPSTPQNKKTDIKITPTLSAFNAVSNGGQRSVLKSTSRSLICDPTQKEQKK